MAKTDDDQGGDPYRTLGVPRTASAEEIRRAFRAVAKRDHPDLNPGDAAAEARFKAANAAHDLLSDPETRARFDRGEIDASGQERAPPGFGGGGPGGGGSGRTYYRDFAERGAGGGRYRAGSWSFRGGGGPEGPDDLGDIFAEYFGGAAGGPAGAPRRGRDERYRLEVPFLDAVNGATTRIVLADGRERDLRVPPGVEDGTVLRLRGVGGPGRGEGAAAGDALVEVSVAPHPVFRRSGPRDLEVEVPVTLAEAALGARVEVPTPRGAVSLAVPPRSEAGTRLRLRGRGVAAGPGGDPPAGDLHAVLRLALGPVDEALEEALRAWSEAGGGRGGGEALRRAAFEAGSGGS